MKSFIINLAIVVAVVAALFWKQGPAKTPAPGSEGAIFNLMPFIALGLFIAIAILRIFLAKRRK